MDLYPPNLNYSIINLAQIKSCDILKGVINYISKLGISTICRIYIIE